MINTSNTCKCNCSTCKNATASTHLDRNVEIGKVFHDPVDKPLDVVLSKVLRDGLEACKHTTVDPDFAPVATTGYSQMRQLICCCMHRTMATHNGSSHNSIHHRHCRGTWRWPDRKNTRNPSDRTLLRTKRRSFCRLIVIHLCSIPTTTSIPTPSEHRHRRVQAAAFMEYHCTSSSFQGTTQRSRDIIDSRLVQKPPLPPCTSDRGVTVVLEGPPAIPATPQTIRELLAF